MGCCGNNEVRPSRNEVRDSQHDDFDGPLEDRSCRDLIFLVVFLAYMVFMTYIMIAALGLGDAYRIFYGVDSWGNTCERQNDVIQGANLSGRDMRDLKYSFYFNPEVMTSANGESVIICSRSCPTSQLDSVADLQALYRESATALCRYDVDVGSYHNGRSDGLGLCPYLPIKATGLVLRRCVPTIYSEALQSVGDSITSLLNTIDENFAEKCVSDLETAWREIIYLCLIALGLSLVVVILLRFFAFIMIWAIAIALTLGVLIGTVFCWVTYANLMAKLDATASPSTEQEDEAQNWLIAAICVSIVTVIVLLILLVLRSRIALVVQLFEEAGKAIGEMPFLLFQPLWTMVVLAGTTAGLIFVFLYIETASNPSVDKSTGHVTFTPDLAMQYLKWFFILGIIWVTQFISASQELVIASATSIWFFTRDKSALRFPILTSIGRLIRYHLGSVAMGSFIITLVKFVRLVLSWIEGRLHGASNAGARFCLKCCACCLWCLENVLKFLNRNAYIIIAIHGYSFCKSARRAFSVIVCNALQLTAINCVGDFMLFLAKVGTVAAVACIGIQLFKDRQEIFYIWLPITLACVFAYFISSCFMDVYEMTIDTVFVCFAEDREMNDGVNRPYYMSLGLMKFVENSQQAISIAERRGQKD